MNAELALAALEFMPNKAAGIISKVIASAVANGDYEPEEVVITSCRVDKAAMMKRWRPRARGTATRILKPTSHIVVEVAEASAEAPKASEKKGDDLTKIKGIGKAYQQKLNDEGIFTYEDVANMSDEQIAMMEEKYSFKGDFRESVADAKNIVNGKEA
jgi:large subunit ribosomal protein L22